MAVAYYLRAGGQTATANELEELAELVDPAIGGDDRIERIQRADGGALDDDEFGHILERLRTRAQARRSDDAQT